MKVLFRWYQNSCLLSGLQIQEQFHNIMKLGILLNRIVEARVCHLINKTCNSTRILQEYSIGSQAVTPTFRQRLTKGWWETLLQNYKTTLWEEITSKKRRLLKFRLDYLDWMLTNYWQYKKQTLSRMENKARHHHVQHLVSGTLENLYLFLIQLFSNTFKMYFIIHSANA